MQERFPVEKDSSLRRVTGYFSRFYRELVNGHDTVATITKACVVAALGAHLVGTMAAGIISSGVAGAVIFALSSLVDEYFKNEAEDIALARLDNLEKANRHLITELEQEFEHEHDYSGRFWNKGKNKQIEEKTLSSLKNGELLKLLLRNYLSTLELYNIQRDEEFEQKLRAKRRKNGKLPQQEGMISLIESVTGFSRRHPHFASAVQQYLAAQKDIEVEAKFNQRVVKALCLKDRTPLPPNRNLLVENAPPQKSFFAHLRSFGAALLFSVAKTNTVLGIILISGILLGVVHAGVFVGWPIIASAIALGLVAFTASLAYKYFVEKDYESNAKNIEVNLSYQNNRYQLTKKLHRLRSKEYRDLNEYDAYQTNSKIFVKRFSILRKTRVSAVKSTTHFRHVVDRIAQGMYGLSIGILIGIAVSTVICLLATVSLAPVMVPLLITTGGIAGAVIFGLRYSYWFSQMTHQSGEDEKRQINRTARLLKKASHQFGKNLIQQKLARTKQELILELMLSYRDYASRIKSDNPTQLDEMLSKKEKILLLIEKTVGISRERNTGTGLPNNSDDKFFEALSLYLQKKEATKAHANHNVSEFKAAILNKQPAECRVTANPTWFPSWNDFRQGVKNFNQNILQKHLFSVLAAVSIAFPLAFLLFNPAGPVIPLLIMGGFALTVFCVHKYCEYWETKNKEKMADIETKLPLIECIEKTKQSKEKIVQESAKVKGANNRKVYGPTQRVVREPDRKKVRRITTRDSSSAAAVGHQQKLTEDHSQRQLSSSPDLSMSGGGRHH